MASIEEHAAVEETRVRMGENGRLVIPATIRKRLGIHSGDTILLRLDEGELRVTTQQRRIERAQRRARHYVKAGVSLSADLLRERREAAKNE